MTGVDRTRPDGSGAATRPPNFRSALAHRDFALLWSGQTLSSVGNQVFPLGLAVFVLSTGRGASALGAILGTMSAAVIAGTLTAATLGDRWRRTRVMVVADVVRALAVAALALSPSDASTVLLAVPVAVVGFGEGLFAPAFAASTPRFLPEDLLQPGNGLNSLSIYVAMVLGPGLAGVFSSVWGARSALWVDVATFAVSIGTLIAVRESQPEPDEAAATGERPAGAVRQMARDLRGGITAVVERPWIGASIAMATVIMSLVTAPALVLLPVVADDRLGGSGAYSATLVVMGIGAVMGTVIGSRVRARRQGLVALCCVSTNAACVLGLAYLPLAGVLVTWWLAGVGVIVFQIIWTTALQKDVPDQVMARVMALDWLGSQALMPVGYALAGPMSHLVGRDAVLVAGAVLMLIVVPLPLFTSGGTTFSSGGRPPAPTPLEPAVRASEGA